MAQQIINVGTIPNDGTGDLLRDAMIKVNGNFTELYTNATISTSVTVGNSIVNTFVNSTFISTQTAVFSNNLTVNGNLTVGGNVVLSGCTTFVNATVITTKDKNIVLANGAANSIAANNSGIVIGTFANLIYNSTANAFQSNVDIIPYSNNLNFGNTTTFWNIYANNISASNIATNIANVYSNINVANVFSVNTTTLVFDSLNNVNTHVVVNSAQITIGNKVGVFANGSLGSAFQLLTSNGSAVYWAALSGPSIDLNYQYNWNNTHTFANTVSLNGNSVIIARAISANGDYGTNNYVLTTSGIGSNVYWGAPHLIIAANTTDTQTFYFPMSNSSSNGFWSNAVVDSTLTYVPSTGTMSAKIFNTTSDRNVKKDIHIIEDAVDIINKLNGVRFNWKKSGNPSAGLIAQDVEKVMPELVDTDHVSGVKSLNYSGVIAVLVEAVKYLLEKDKD